MNQRGNIHIDKFRVIGTCKHKPLGEVWYLRDPENGKLVPKAVSATQNAIQEDMEEVYFRSKGIQKDGMASQLLIDCCPPAVLQKHNWCGLESVGDYVYAVFDLAVKVLGIDVTEEDRAAWRKGQVQITEVHLTANFGCPGEYVTAIIDAIDANNGSGKKRELQNTISLGWSPKRRSKYRLLSIYYKWDELRHRFGPNPGRVRTKLLAEAKNSIRAEIKLFSQFLDKHQLNNVSAWRKIDVEDLYFKIFEKFKIRHAVQRILTEDELRLLNELEKKAYILWLHDVDIKDQFKSRTTVNWYIRSIKRKTGIDCGARRRPQALANIDLREVFKPSNILPVPAWLKNTPYFYQPPSSMG